MRFLLFFLLLLTTQIPPTLASCSNLCSGHGSCTFSTCTCYPGYAGPSCSLRTCPSHPAFSDIATALNTAHAPAECSNRGTCDYTAGTCTCQQGYIGSACQKLTCHNSCSDHGTCVSMKDAALLFNNVNLNRSTTYDLWDADMVFGCDCDYGFSGYDCSMKNCPIEDDPRTFTSVMPITTELFCQCDAVCSGQVSLRKRGTTFQSSHSTSASEFQTQLLNLPGSLRNAAIYEGNPPVDVTMTGGSTLCSAAGTTSAIRFTRLDGPALLDIRYNNLESTGATPVIYFVTKQELTCVCVGVCGGMFTLEMDDLYSPNLPFNIDQSTLVTELQNLHGRVRGSLVTNLAVVATAGGDGVCKDSSSTLTTISFNTDVAEVPILTPTSSITDAGAWVEDAISIVSDYRGTAVKSPCNGIGTCDYHTGACYCGEFWRGDQLVGSCAMPVYNTSGWVGVETCPGLVEKGKHSETLSLPTSMPRVYYSSTAGVANTGMHSFAFGEDSVDPVFISSDAGALHGAGVALDLSERFLYNSEGNQIMRYALYDTSGAAFANVEPYSGPVDYVRTTFKASAGDVIFGMTADVRFGQRYLYWTTTGYLDGTSSVFPQDGTISRCRLDKGAATHCTEEDLTSTINAALGFGMADPAGIALDLANEKMYWVDSGTDSDGDGAIYIADLDGANARVFFNRGLNRPYGIALDLRLQIMYVTEMREGTGYGAIGSLPMQNIIDTVGATQTQVTWSWLTINSGTTTAYRITDPLNLVFHSGSNYLIFTDTFHQKIFYASVETGQQFLNSGVYTGSTTVLEPFGLALDPGHGYPDGGDKAFAECFGNGRCLGFAGEYRCECNQGFTGNCNSTACPTGTAWFDEARSVDDAHRPTECSNMGTCQRATGTCACRPGFSGAACERMDCPTDSLTLSTCNGKGRCRSMEQLGQAYRNDLGDPSVNEYAYLTSSDQGVGNTWDANMIFGCFCDEHWYDTTGIAQPANKTDPFGYDCSLFRCPFGDNPSSPFSGANTEVYEEQEIVCTADGGEVDVIFKGERILVEFDATLEAFTAALLSLKTIGNVTVVYSTGTVFCTAGGTNAVKVTFLSELGKQPEFTFDVKVFAGFTMTATATRTVIGSKELVECSGQGVCDYKTGVCECFDGFASSDGNNGRGLRQDCGFQRGFGDNSLF